MFDLDSWQEIWSTITRNKTRSLLTAFGVFWGLFMLIVLMGIGSGFKSGVFSMLDGLDVRTVVFQSDATGLPYKGYRKGRYWNMTSRDLPIIRQNAQSVEYMTPLLSGRSGDSNTVRGLKSGSYSNVGLLPDYFKINAVEVLQGRILNEMDEEQNRKVCVIGEEVYETLFDIDEDPIGQNIRLNGIYFQVVGVVKQISQMTLFSYPPTTIYIPFSTMQRTFTRGDYIHALFCSAKPGYPSAMVEEEVSDILKRNHDIAPEDTQAIYSYNIEKELMLFQNLTLGVNVLVLIVGLGALFSGVIGISNIMLVTVRERTREIGVRRALGAKPRNILWQVMSESLVLTSLAGLVGFLVAVGVLAVASQIMEASPIEGFGPPLISFGLALGAMAILIASGALAGLMPALKALQIKAIDALRDE
ncbi:MAG: ABC transporter permease [Rikenellaceae bacterium]|jgi:putative ABC transport system permease protein|nr:ABC transporter permease [Rikenellaceae bacterium]MDR0955300.1 ABC transporter permease [Rikenellaceae bacterium]